jgi:hypothetical protein
MALKKLEKPVPETEGPNPKAKCGVIMPISTIGEYPESHWSDVLDIISDAVADAGFEANLVSFADESTFIHKTIVQNLYTNPIVICDVSGKNPNVMFELGLRLAFDKPTIIVKDDVTTYSFDTGAIEHLPYPKDLRFAKIIEFKAKLTSKITATLKAAENADYSTFLKQFGKFRVTKLEEKEVSSQEYVIESLKTIQDSLATLNARVLRPFRNPNKTRTLFLDVANFDEHFRARLRRSIQIIPGVLHTSIHAVSGEARLIVETEEASLSDTQASIEKILLLLKANAAGHPTETSSTSPDCQEIP